MTQDLEQLRYEAIAAALLATWPKVVAALLAAERLVANEREAAIADEDRADELDDACPALTKALGEAIDALPVAVRHIMKSTMSDAAEAKAHAAVIEAKGHADA